MRPSHEELKTLWVYCYARASLLEAEQWLDAMGHTDAESSQFRALLCAAVVAYARPFTISQVTPKERLVPLDGVLPPPQLVASHAMLLKSRDKLFGHKDGTPAKGDSTTPNLLLIRRRATDVDLHTVFVKEMGPHTRKEAKELCSHFVAHCESLAQPILDRCQPEIMRRPIGVYELLV